MTSSISGLPKHFEWADTLLATSTLAMSMPEWDMRFPCKLTMRVYALPNKWQRFWLRFFCGITYSKRQVTDDNNR